QLILPKMALVISALFLAYLFLKPSTGSRLKTVATLLSASLLAVAIYGWDQRTPWTKLVESPDPPATLSLEIPDSAHIYWEGGLDMLWLRLRRASYFSCDQGTGV